LANDGDTDIRVATNVIHHLERTPSFLEMPVVR
jgi:predicted acyl esterase